MAGKLGQVLDDLKRRVDDLVAALGGERAPEPQKVPVRIPVSQDPLDKYRRR